mgnify:CR=1 FL=1
MPNQIIKSSADKIVEMALSPIKLYKFQHYYKKPVLSGLYKARFERGEFLDNNPTVSWFYFRILDGKSEGEVVSVKYHDETWSALDKPNHDKTYLLACELANRLLTDSEYIDLDLDCLVGRHCYVEIDKQENVQVIFSFEQREGVK